MCFSPASDMTVKIKAAQIKPPVTVLKSPSKISPGRLFCSPLTASHQRKYVTCVFMKGSFVMLILERSV